MASMTELLRAACRQLDRWSRTHGADVNGTGQHRDRPRTRPAAVTSSEEDEVIRRLELIYAATQAQTAYLTAIVARVACDTEWMTFEAAISDPERQISVPARTPDSFDAQIAAAFDVWVARYHTVDPQDWPEVKPPVRDPWDPAVRQR
jgi:hypothetical protein